MSPLATVSSPPDALTYRRPPQNFEAEQAGNAI